ncbi:PREDICTED: cholesteryl ester transfer protein [Nanorana parkeri]|uniref:cholesteryl ester transfer protein n=1 Tax=Nanorana parkeri TaxID=125878 RepID=UPI000854FE5A|nr:PREDICTED: cholesteryl ester transfer protein [Nanorana parkeri]
MWLLVVFSACFLRISSACELKPSSPQETGIVCRLTKPAALVLNEKTTEVIQAAFRHATFPNITGEKAVRFLGSVTYGLTNIEVSDLSIESSGVELKKDDAVDIMIRNVSASFKGVLNYGYGTWFVNVRQSIDFEIYSSIDLQLNTKLTCGKNRVAADISDCYLSFHKLDLYLHGNKQPGWLKQLFTDFIAFTLKLVLKSQICKEVNYVANVLAEFIQDRAEDFLSVGDIRMNIDVTSFPIIKDTYMESHHKGFLEYKNLSVYYNSSIYAPSLLTEDKMLYFWFSEQVLDYLVLGYYLDERLVLTLTGAELKDIFKDDNIESHQQIISEILHDLPLSNTVAKVWSLTRPQITMKPKGTIVKASVAVQINVSATKELYFETETVTTIQTSYGDKKLTLLPNDSIVQVTDFRSSLAHSQNEESVKLFLQKTVTDLGIPFVAKHLGPVLTSLMNTKGLNLFEIINPEVIPHEGYLIVQLDFGFPHHLLVDFLKKSL